MLFRSGQQRRKCIRVLLLSDAPIFEMEADRVAEVRRRVRDKRLKDPRCMETLGYDRLGSVARYDLDGSGVRGPDSDTQPCATGCGPRNARGFQCVPETSLAISSEIGRVDADMGLS